LKIGYLEEVQGIHIKKYLKFMVQRRSKPTYINGVLKTIRAFFKYCMQEEYIVKNPTEKVGWQKEGKVIINTFTSSEILKMLGTKCL